MNLLRLVQGFLLLTVVQAACTNKKKVKDSTELTTSAAADAASTGTSGAGGEGGSSSPIPVPNLPESAGTVVAGGSVTTARWTARGSPYRVQGDIVLGADARLDIEAGVTVIFMGPYKFSIHGGVLRIRGTATEPVRFTASLQQPGWYGILMCPDSNCTSEQARGQIDVDYGVFEYARANDRTGDFRYWRRGGAMLILNPESVILRRSIFRSNEASEVGGALELIAIQNDKTVVLENLVFRDNLAGSGGAVRLSHVHNRTWTGLVFERNRVLGYPDSYGGAIESEDAQNITLSNVVARGNEAKVSGGAFYCYAPDIRLMPPYLFSGNKPEHSVGCGIESQVRLDEVKEGVVVTLDVPREP